MTQLRRSSPEGSQTPNCQVRVDHHPEFIWCFSKICLFYFFTPFVSGAPISKKRKKVGTFISSRVGTVSHIKAGNLSNFTKACKAVGGKTGAWLGYTSENGPKSHPKRMVILSHWVFPVYRKPSNWRFKACISPALKMMAVFSIHSVNFWCQAESTYRWIFMGTHPLDIRPFGRGPTTRPPRPN